MKEVGPFLRMEILGPNGEVISSVDTLDAVMLGVNEPRVTVNYTNVAEEHQTKPADFRGLADILETFRAEYLIPAQPAFMSRLFGLPVYISPQPSSAYNAINLGFPEPSPEPGNTYEEYVERTRAQAARDRDRFTGVDAHSDEPLYDMRTGSLE